MFSPRGRGLERGWPGRIEGDRVIQLAAQTLQSFFTGGGMAREHAEYPLDEVDLRAPVLHPPSVRIFDGGDFAFANPAAIHGPDDTVLIPEGADAIDYELRPAVVIGADGSLGGITLLNVFAADLEGAKARDFALALGPVVVTGEDVPDLGGIDWDRLLGHAARNTLLVPGDVIAADPLERGPADGVVEPEVPGIGVLSNRVAR